MTERLHVVHELDRAVGVSDDRVELLRYVYDADDPQVESPRPYVHPLRSRDGDVVSVYRPWDHVWHKGLSLSLPHLGGDNFWGGPTYVRDQGYQWLPNNGAMRHEGSLDVDRNDDRIDLRHGLRWITQSGRHVVDETRRMHVQLIDDSAWALVFDSRWHNVSGTGIRIGSPTTEGRENAGYGGLLWRGPRSFEGARILLDGASGGDELMGTRSAWAAIVGQHDETARWSSVLMTDDRDNLRHPVRWFARSSPFACLCPAPFFDEVYDFEDGAELTLRYAMLVDNGQADGERLAWLASQGQALLDKTRYRAMP